MLLVIFAGVEITRPLEFKLLMPATRHPATKVNKRHEAHHCFHRLTPDYPIVFSTSPKPAFIPKAEIDNSLLRKFLRDCEYPYKTRWNRPREHIVKHYSGDKKIVIDQFFFLVIDEINDILSALEQAGITTKFIDNQKKFIEDLIRDSDIHQDAKYYSIPSLLSLLTHLCYLILPLQTENNRLGDQILSVISSYLTYPATDSNSFELRITYRGYVEINRQEVEREILAAIRLGRSQKARTHEAVPWSPLEYVQFQTIRFVTTFANPRGLNTPGALTCHVTFQ